MFNETMLKEPIIRKRGIFMETRQPTKPCVDCNSIYVIAGFERCNDCHTKSRKSFTLPATQKLSGR
ncbi:MAG: hypothetical protein V1729_04535 [Candidatus Woesearchaeota archaeon]